MSLTPGRPADSATPARDRARFVSGAVGSSMVLVTAEGEIDAANAAALGGYVEARLKTTSHLVLDLRDLSFFGTQGFSSIHRINVMCSRHAVNWVVVAGSEVRRLLRICDPDGGLPVADTLAEAIATAVRPPRSHLRLVSDD